jgi:hypothetical protein
VSRGIPLATALQTLPPGRSASGRRASHFGDKRVGKSPQGTRLPSAPSNREIEDEDDDEDEKAPQGTPQGTGLNAAKLSDASDPNPNLNRNRNPFSNRRLRLGLGLRLRLRKESRKGRAFPQSLAVGGDTVGAVTVTVEDPA